MTEDIWHVDYNPQQLLQIQLRVSSGPQSQCGMEAGLFKTSKISLEQPSHQYRTAKPQGLLGEPKTTLRTIHTHSTVCLCFFS